MVGKKAIIQHEPPPPGDAHTVGQPSYDKITRILGWQPKVGVKEGMQKVFDAYLESTRRAAWTVPVPAAPPPSPQGASPQPLRARQGAGRSQPVLSF